MLTAFRRHAHYIRTQLMHHRRRRAYRECLPSVPQRFQQLLEELRTNGIALTSLDQLAIPGTVETLAGLDRLFAATDRLSAKPGEYAVHATEEQIMAEAEVIRWGLDPGLLALVENYIGVPIAYRGLTARRECADGKFIGTRMWHRDDEDAAILKIIIYLNDVDLQTGPFQCIPAPYTPPEWRIPLVETSRVTDADMERLVPRNHWVACAGVRGTVVLADTCRLYHRGIVPEQRDRRAAFFCYNSTEPLNPDWCQPLFDREKFRSNASLSPPQSAALSYTY